MTYDADLMKVGIQLPEVEYETTWPQERAMAQAIEAAGFDSIWVGDHLLYETADGVVGPWDCWTTMAAIAAVTERVEIGPLVAALPFYNPAMLARQAAKVADISGGRFVFGVGAGWNRAEFEAFGHPYERRVDNFAESFEVVRRMMNGETVAFDGEFHQVGGARLLPTAPEPPPEFMIGSNRPRMLGIALPHASRWNTWFASYGNRPEGLVPLVATIDEACEQAGRDPADIEYSAAVLVAFGEPDGRRNGDDPITGSADEVADMLYRIGETGIDHVQLVLDPIDLGSIGSAAEALAALRSR